MCGDRFREIYPAVFNILEKALKIDNYKKEKTNANSAMQLKEKRKKDEFYEKYTKFGLTCVQKCGCHGIVK